MDYLEKGSRLTLYHLSHARINFNLYIRLPKSVEIDGMIESAGLDAMEYDKQYDTYRVRLTKDDVTSKAAVLKELASLAYARRIGS